MSNVVVIVRGINSLSVTRKFAVNSVLWPSDLTLYRGGGLPNEHAAFFTVRKMYRAPMFLSTSTDWAYCKSEFCSRAQYQGGLNAVLFVIYLHREYKCFHVNYVKHTVCAGERVPLCPIVVADVH